MRSIQTYEAVSEAIFRDKIRPLNEPAVLKGLVADWPAVTLAQQSDEALADYIVAHDTGEPAGVYVGPPQIDGKFFYGMDSHSYNFDHGAAPIPQAIERILQERANSRPHAVYVQSAPVERHMPGFGAQNRLDILSPDIKPRIWIGNASVTRAHFDTSLNIACVIAGQRQFKLFPPEQSPSLYPGPLERTIGGVPVSMVDIDNPDLDTYPRFACAQDAMLTADLESGDALFIPYGWWHHVRSTSAFNVLINYWWNEAVAPAQPYEALYHALLAIRSLPENERDVWKTLFDYYVFASHGDPAAHLRMRDRGILGDLTPKEVDRLKRSLTKSLLSEPSKPVS
jgi:hypothetical protein